MPLCSRSLRQSFVPQGTCLHARLGVIYPSDTVIAPCCQEFAICAEPDAELDAVNLAAGFKRGIGVSKGCQSLDEQNSEIWK